MTTNTITSKIDPSKLLTNQPLAPSSPVPAVAVSFAQVVSVLMRDPHYRKMPLADLERLVLPPLMLGQFAVAHAPTRSMPSRTGTAQADQSRKQLIPVAVALWARVSGEIDRVLSENIAKPLQLRVGDWASGTHTWITTVAGNERALPRFLAQLQEKEFKRVPVNLRRHGPDGVPYLSALTPRG
jgi:hemolysin-activating ACP:hemolysin acyltransferase